MRSWPRALAALTVLLTAAVAQAQWVYVLGADGRITVVDAPRRSVVRTIDLPWPGVARLHPTPGGKYILVSWRDRSDIAAVDVEAHAVSRTFTLPNGPIDDLEFSPMGDTVLTTRAGSTQVDLWSHSRSVLQPLGSVSAGVAGSPALFNRRATRLYRSGVSGLDFVYLKTGELITEVALPGGPMAWVFTPDFRYLWGSSADGGSVAVVDEGRGRLVESLELPHRAHAPVISGDGGRLWLIDAQGRSLVGLDTRTRKAVARLDLGGDITGLSAGPASEIWAHDPSGKLSVIDGRRGAVTASVIVPGGTHQAVYITLRKGEGYACF